MLIFNLKTFENKNKFVFIFNNFDLKALILIVNEYNKIFIIEMISKIDEIANIFIN